MSYLRCNTVGVRGAVKTKSIGLFCSKNGVRWVDEGVTSQETLSGFRLHFAQLRLVVPFFGETSPERIFAIAATPGGECDCASVAPPVRYQWP